MKSIDQLWREYNERIASINRWHRIRMVALVIVVLLLLLGPVIAAFGQGPPVPSDRPDVPRDGGAPGVPGVSEPKAKPLAAMLTHATAYALAKKEHKPLVLFVDMEARQIAGIVTVSVPTLNDDADPRIVAAADPDSRGLTLSADATDAQIRRAAGMWVQPVATPFERKSAKREGLESLPVGGDGSLAFLSDLEVYQSARRVQVSFRRWSGMITSTSRESVEARWKTNGGLVGVEGWTSTLYRSRGERARVFLARDDPSDGNSQVTWQRSYGDVTFADVLRNADGEVFEVRVAEKSGGVWDRYAAYQNAAARPHGYSGLPRKACVECHNRAGENAYGSAAIPGGDTVFSDAIEPVESGRTVQGGFGTRLN